MAALTEWYDVELTYTSNAIEGNTLTRVETAEVFEKGLASPAVVAKPIEDQLEVIGHKEALAFVHDLARRSDPIREVDVRAIHRLILARIDPEEAGKYSDHERFIRGSPLVLPSPWELKPLMSDFGQWLAVAEPGPESAFEAHARLVTIHPFKDGNGRTARLLMNLLLMRAGYSPMVIGPEHRVEYLDRLQKLQLENDRSEYERFMYERSEASLEDWLTRLGASNR
ncbi:MAG TPA: Fic family protein [Bryobacteraceae bacterium]|nr:Fic family protein [Bryobacteraceae bacterium]